MPAQLFDLVDDLTQDPEKRDAIEQGADFAWTVAFEAADTDATVAADWLARLQVRLALADSDTSTAPLVDLDSDALGGIVITVVPDAGGDYLSLAVSIGDAVTAALPIGRHYYDLELVRVADGFVRRIVKGRAQVSGEVTR